MTAQARIFVFTTHKLLSDVRTHYLKFFSLSRFSAHLSSSAFHFFRGDKCLLFNEISAIMSFQFSRRVSLSFIPLIKMFFETFAFFLFVAFSNNMEPPSTHVSEGLDPTSDRHSSTVHSAYHGMSGHSVWRLARSFFLFFILYLPPNRIVYICSCLRNLCNCFTLYAKEVLPLQSQWRNNRIIIKWRE